MCAPCLGAIAGVTYQIAIDAYSGEFDVTDFDSYGPYFRDNWVDLSASAITGAAVFWNGPVYLGKLAWFLTAPILEDKVFDYFDTNWTEIAGDTIVDFAGDTYDWTCQNTSTSACDWVEGAIDDIGDTAEDISDVISDVWHSIF